MSSNRPQPGPSGKPARHFIECSSQAEAKEAARRKSSSKTQLTKIFIYQDFSKAINCNLLGSQSPIHHQPHNDGQKPHYHPADANGDKKESGAHYTYPKK